MATKGAPEYPIRERDVVYISVCLPAYKGNFVSQVDRNLVEEIANTPLLPMYEVVPGFITF